MYSRFKDSKLLCHSKASLNCSSLNRQISLTGSKARTRSISTRGIPLQTQARGRTDLHHQNPALVRLGAFRVKPLFNLNNHHCQASRLLGLLSSLHRRPLSEDTDLKSPNMPQWRFRVATDMFMLRDASLRLQCRSMLDLMVNTIVYHQDI